MTNLFFSISLGLAIMLSGCSNSDQETANNLPAPVVSIDAVPNAVKGSTNIQVTFNNQVVDQKQIVAVSFLYSADGVNFIPVGSVNPSASVYEWTIPRIDTSTAQVKIVAKDNRGFSNSKISNTFAILSTPPLITVTTNNAVVSNATAVTFGGTCKAGVPITFFPGLTPDVSAAMQAHYAKLSAPTCTSQGTWSFPVSESVLDDVFSYTLQQSDIVGNSTQATFTWTRTCASNQFANGETCASQLCAPGTTSVDKTGCSNSGTRTQTCAMNGSSWSTYTACTCSAGYTGADCSTCSTGYFLSGTSCVPDVCNPNSITSDNSACSAHGTRTETCSTNGSGFGTWSSCACAAGYTGTNCSTCSTGYYNNNGSCVADVCTPGAVTSDSTACSLHGTRTETCSTNGSSAGTFGSCACSAGYTGASCASCASGYYLNGSGSCVSDVCSPTAVNSDSTGCSSHGTRSQTCSTNGSTWNAFGACSCSTGYTGATCSTCSTGYTLSGNSCIPEVCTPGTVQADATGCSNDGSRSRTCSTDGSAWGSYGSCACSAGYTGTTCTTCAIGYFKSGNSCVADVCSPSTVQSDSSGCSSDGSRSRTCAADGSAWGNYGACSCATGYTGTSCSSCASGYYFNGTACVIETCAPNVAQTDTLGCSSEGSRSRTCTTTGSAWGAYTTCACKTGYNGSDCSSCAAGYYFNSSGGCSAQACAPNAVDTETTGCSAHGMQSRACTASGSNWGAFGSCACNVGWTGASCAACDTTNGYTMVGNSCVQQVTINYSMTESAAQYYTDTVPVDANLSMSGNEGHAITTATTNTPSTAFIVTAGETITASCYGGANWGSPWPTGRTPEDTLIIKDQLGNVVYNQSNPNQANTLTTNFVANSGSIYTVDCHSSRAATCTCGTGFSVTADNNGCLKTSTAATLKAPNRQPIIQGDTDSRYYAMPGIMADTKSSTLMPFSMTTADSGITGITASDGTAFPFTAFTPTPFWLNRVTSASRVSIKSNNDANNGWLTKAYCVNVTTAADYAFHIGADNEWQIKIDGTEFAQCTSGDGSDVYCYRGPQFLTSHLYVAQHTIELKYQNLTGPGAVWFEIFQNNLTDLKNATSISSLNLISSTASLQTGSTWDYTGDACPTGYSLDVCSSTSNAQCTMQQHTDCN